MVSTQQSWGDICFLKIPYPNTEKCLISVILKKGKEIQQQRQKTPSMFLPLTLFWPDVHEINNNLNLVQLFFTIKFIVHLLSCFCVSENILSIEQKTGVQEIAFNRTLNQEKSDNSVCLHLWI